MIITFATILTALLFLIRPLQRNPFFLVYFGLMMALAYVVEEHYIRVRIFSRNSVLLFFVFHFIVINVVTFFVYGIDKRAAKRGDQRVPEMQMHSLEFLGGWPGAYMGQKTFRHKTKKRSYQALFWLILPLQVIFIYFVLQYLNILQ